MLTKSSTVLLGLVLGFVSISATPATAQETPSVMFHRVCTIASGQAQAAVAFALEVVDYFDENYAETQMISFRPALQPNNYIHWVTNYDNMEAYGALTAVLFQDSGYGALLLKAQGTFVPDSCADDLSVKLR